MAKNTSPILNGIYRMLFFNEVNMKSITDKIHELEIHSILFLIGKLKKGEELKYFDVTCYKRGYQVSEKSSAHYRKLIWLVKLLNCSLSIWSVTWWECNHSSHIVRGIFKSTEEEFENSMSKIHQEKCHGNSVQRGSSMVMINVNCLH